MNSAMGRLLLAAGLLVSPAVLAEDSKEKPQASETAKAAPVADPSGPAAPLMVVTIDPETGKLRPATAEERAALLAAGGARVLGLTGRETYVERRRDGSKVARLGPEYLRWSVTRVGPDGKVSNDCVAAGKAAAVTPQGAAPPAPEK